MTLFPTERKSCCQDRIGPPKAPPSRTVGQRLDLLHPGGPRILA